MSAMRDNNCCSPSLDQWGNQLIPSHYSTPIHSPPPLTHCFKAPPETAGGASDQAADLAADPLPPQLQGWE